MGCGVCSSCIEAVEAEPAHLPQEPAKEHMEKGNSLGQPNVSGSWPEPNF